MTFFQASEKCRSLAPTGRSALGVGSRKGESLGLVLRTTLGGTGALEGRWTRGS